MKNKQENILSSFMDKFRLTPKRLSYLTGLSYTHILNITNGYKKLTIQAASRILNATGKPPQELGFTEDDLTYHLSNMIAKEENNPTKLMGEIIRQLENMNAKKLAYVLKVVELTLPL